MRLQLPLNRKKRHFLPIEEENVKLKNRKSSSRNRFKV